MLRATGARDWLTASPLRADALFAAVVFAVGAAVLRMGGGLSGAGCWLVLVLAASALALRRTRPALAVGGVVAANLLAPLLGISPLAARLPLLIMLYTAAALLGVRAATAAAAVLAVPVVVQLLFAAPPRAGFDQWLGQGLTLLVCFLVGRTVHTQRAYTQALEERARTAEAGREASAREAVLEERRRIARELHDVVAHHVSVMGVLASGARRALTRDPAAAGEALGTIESTGRTALRELGRLLDVLRRDDENDAVLEPQPGVAGLEALAAQVREAGLPVRLSVSGEAVPLDPGVDLTVFRVVQEGLTNALKHAGPRAAATVSVEFGPDRILVRVDDDGVGHGAATVPAGHGLVGMRERVSLYGGFLSAGQGAGAGYSVVAAIPIEAAREVRR